jgi:hypothetical protein
MLSKIFFNSVAPILLKIRWRRVDLKIFSNKEERNKLNTKLSKTPTINNAKKSKILIGSIRSLAHSNLFEGGVGQSFVKAGVPVSVLRCGQFLKSCETKSHFKDNQMSCSMCHKEFDYFTKSFGLNEITYDSLIDIKLKREILDFIETIDLNSFSTWKGVSLRNEWLCALQRYYLSTDTKISENPEIAEQFLYTVLTSFEVGRILVEEKQFTHLFTSHGIYSTWGGLLAGFRNANGDVTVWGRGYYKSGIVSFKNESYLNGLKNLDRSYIINNYNSKYLDEVKTYLDSKWKLSNDNDSIKYYDKDTIATEFKLELKEGKKYISFFPNIPWDGQAFVSTENYKNLNDIIESLLSYVKTRSDVHIIVRPHPAENPSYNPNIGETFLDISKQYKLDSHPSFTIIPYESSITSYDVADLVKANVLFAGTIGVELAAKGLNVIQLGKNVSSNKGFYLEPKTYDELKNSLNLLLDENYSSNSDDISKNALQWASFYYAQGHMEDIFFKYSGYRMVDIVDDLDTEKLSHYMNWVLEGKGLYHS